MRGIIGSAFEHGVVCGILCGFVTILGAIFLWMSVAISFVIGAVGGILGMVMLFTGISQDHFSMMEKAIPGQPEKAAACSLLAAVIIFTVIFIIKKDEDIAQVRKLSLKISLISSIFLQAVLSYFFSVDFYAAKDHMLLDIMARFFFRLGYVEVLFLVALFIFTAANNIQQLIKYHAEDTEKRLHRPYYSNNEAISQRELDNRGKYNYWKKSLSEENDADEMLDEDVFYGGREDSR